MTGSTQQHPDVYAAIADEARRIEEDALYSSRGHFSAARRWSQAHFWLGLPAAAAAAISGATAIANSRTIAAILAMVVTALTATLTFLNPSEKANAHHAAGTRFNALRNNSRRFREVAMQLANDAKALADALATLAKERDSLNDASPQIPRWAFIAARQSIEEGEATHAIDSPPV